MSSSKKPGRPKGAPNITDTAEVVPSRCPHCGSSRRTEYQNVHYWDYSGAGLEFVGIYYRACRCLDCSRPRRDQEKVFPPGVDVATTVA